MVWPSTYEEVILLTRSWDASDDRVASYRRGPDQKPHALPKVSSAFRQAPDLLQHPLAPEFVIVIDSIHILHGIDDNELESLSDGADSVKLPDVLESG